MSSTTLSSERKVLSSLEDLFRSFIKEPYCFFWSLSSRALLPRLISEAIKSKSTYSFFLWVYQGKIIPMLLLQTKTILEASMSRMLVSHDFCSIYLNHLLIIFLGIKYMLIQICKWNIYISSYKLEKINFSPNKWWVISVLSLNINKSYSSEIILENKLSHFITEIILSCNVLYNIVHI